MNANSYKQLEERDLLIAELRKQLNQAKHDNELMMLNLTQCGQQLAAIQAREQQLLKRVASTIVLLEAVCAVNPDSACAKYELGENRKTVNYPSDTTALEAMIEKAGEVMRERIIKNLLQRGALDDGDYLISIPSLPSIKLEDLK